MWAASEDAVMDTQIGSYPPFSGRRLDGESDMQCVTIGLDLGYTDGPVHVTFLSRAAERVGAERMHALIQH